MEPNFLGRKIEINLFIVSAYKIGRYRTRTCDLTGVIRALYPTELIALPFSTYFSLIESD